MEKGLAMSSPFSYALKYGMFILVAWHGLWRYNELALVETQRCIFCYGKI